MFKLLQWYVSWFSSIENNTTLMTYLLTPNRTLMTVILQKLSCHLVPWT